MKIKRFEELNEGKTTQTIFNNEDKTIIRDNMDKKLIEFYDKFDTLFTFDKKSKMDKISQFIDDAMGDTYTTIIKVLEDKNKKE